VKIYTVVVATTLNEFENVVSRNVKSGWVCQGEIFVGNIGNETGYYQAMTKS
jgi:hypothetical protein